jgi:hypothetical protein
MDQSTWRRHYRRARCGDYRGTDFRAVSAKIKRTSEWERTVRARAAWLVTETTSAHRKSLILACIAAIKPIRPNLP